MPNPQKIPCVVGKVCSHGHQVYTVELIPTRPIPRFYSGQFLHLALDVYDPSSFWPESRVFSIESSPSERDRLKITYSVIGKFTTRMESELTPGKQVWVKMPYGNFFIDSKSPVVLIAGGTGITAFASFLENCKESSENKILVFYGAKERSLLLYRDFLNESKKNNNLQTYYFIENDAKYLEDEIPGQLSVEEIFKRIEAPSLQKYYLSGPPLMLKYLTNGLHEKGIPLESIYIDAWA